MSSCFLCDSKMYGECKQLCSNITPHSNVSYPEKISEALGEEFVIIVTPADYVCKKCSSLLIHMDKLEADLKLVKNAMLSSIQKSYGILPPDHPVNSLEVVNGNVREEEQLEQGQFRVPSDLPVGVSSTITTAAVVTPVQTPLKLTKPQQQQQQQPQPPTQQRQLPTQQRQPPIQQRQPPTQQERPDRMKIYKCGFCAFQSRELGHVRFHMRTHTKKNEPVVNQEAAKALTPVTQQKKRIFRCQVCSKTFDIRMNCLDHIQKNHNKQLTKSTSNNERETEDSSSVTIKVMEPESSKTRENDQHEESPMDVDKKQQDIIKSTVDMYMMLNDPAKRSVNVKVEKIENSEEDKTVNEAKSKILPEFAQEGTEEVEKAGEEVEDTAVVKEEKADQETSENVIEEVDEDNVNVENKMGDLDIESLLAKIHNGNPTINEDT